MLICISHCFAMKRNDKCMRGCFLSSTIMHTMVLFLLTTVEGMQSSTIMKRIRDRSGAEVLENSGDWRIHVTTAVRDILISIDEKLSDDKNKLSRIDYSMDQLNRRFANIETRLSRLETKFDLRLEKVESAVVNKDMMEDHLSRKVEILSEKINSKAAYLDGKLDMKLERITGKLDLLERDLHNSVDDILKRLVKSEEKCMAIETETQKRRRKLDEVQKHITDVLSVSNEEFVKGMEENFEQLNSKVKNLESVVLHHGNKSYQGVKDIREVIQRAHEQVLATVQENNYKIENLSTSFRLNERARSQMYSSEVTTQEQQLENLTTLLDTALKAHEAKFLELDADVEMYTRKVINGIQQLWRTSDELRSDLADTLEQGNRTREIVRQEFRRLHEQIEPLPKLEPKLTDISEDLNEKVSRLSATVDNSFATLLVAQNTFIDSCQRIQQEETTQVYDILQRIVYEMRNRSITDIQKISSDLRAQSQEFNKSLSSALNAVLEVGNLTTIAVHDLVNLVNKKNQCVVFKADEMEWSAIESVCRLITKDEQFSLDAINASSANGSVLSSIDGEKLDLEHEPEMLYDDSEHPQQDAAYSRTEYEEEY